MQELFAKKKEKILRRVVGIAKKRGIGYNIKDNCHQIYAAGSPRRDCEGRYGKIRRNPAKLSQLVKEFDLEILYQATSYEEQTLSISDVNRPALQLVGFLRLFSAQPPADPRPGRGDVPQGNGR